ncbi:flagellar protein FlaG [Pseudomonas akapageensis]|uniref:flagellar protein FlaG n=1 Tax=Pseudomonas akapageensis TaxID=2609961 RepID=UPI0014076774|nr:flagellar protein FlaG [Pseudomonas akapageensis]
MDMSVRLNSSYPASAAFSGNADKADEKPAATNASAKVSAVEKTPDESQLKTAVKEIQDFVQSMQRNLEFSVDKSSGQVVVKVIARDSGEVIRQIPSQTALELAKSLSDASSLLFNEKV